MFDYFRLIFCRLELKILRIVKKVIQTIIECCDKSIKFLDNIQDFCYSNFINEREFDVMNIALLFIILVFVGFMFILALFRTCFEPRFVINGEIILFAFIQTTFVVIVGCLCGKLL